MGPEPKVKRWSYCKCLWMAKDKRVTCIISPWKKWSYYLTYYWVPGSTFVQRWIKTPPEVGTIDSSSEGSWLQGGTERNGMSRFLCRASKWWEFHGCFNPSPQDFVEAHEWLFHALSYHFFFTDLDLAFSLRVVNCSRNPLVLRGEVSLRKWPDQLSVKNIASFNPDV